MKAKIAQSNVKCMNPDFSKEEYRKKNTVEKRLYIKRTPPVIPLAEGEIWEHPEAYKLVELGMATPADDECKDAANMSDEKIQEALSAYRKLSRGMSTGVKKYDVEAEDVELDDEFNELLEDGEYIVSTD